MQVGDYPVTGLILRSSACPQVLSLMQLCLSKHFGLCSPFYLGCFALYPGIACLGYVHYGIACLASQSLLLGRCTLSWPVWPVIGFLLLGVHPSISIVKLIMIGYHCNHSDGQLNCQAFAHWLIIVTIMY